MEIVIYKISEDAYTVFHKTINKKIGVMTTRGTGQWQFSRASDGIEVEVPAVVVFDCITEEKAVAVLAELLNTFMTNRVKVFN